MKQSQRYLLAMLASLLLTVLSNWQTADAVSVEVPVVELSAPAFVPQNHNHHEATLTDATNLYRVCSSRPQRVVPSHGSSSERSAGPCPLARRRIVEPLNSFFDSRRRLETAPFRLSASCKYYVYALRHIIR
jgi:hypothetical protein